MPSAGGVGSTRTDASRVVAASFALLVAGAALAYWALRPGPVEAPAEIAGDPVLVRGHAIYSMHCATCHGASGRGDGPSAADLRGPKPGNLTDPGSWKHGRTPEAVGKVIADGVADAAMPGWRGMIGDDGVRAAAAYVLHLAGRPAAVGGPAAD